MGWVSVFSSNCVGLNWFDCQILLFNVTVDVIYDKQEDIPAATKRSNFLGLPAVIVIIAAALAIEEYGDKNL